MSHPERPSSLFLFRFFHGSACLLVVIGFSMIAITDQISHLACWLFLAGYVTSLVPWVNLSLQLTPRQANWATRLYALFFAVDIFLISRSFVPATLHLVLFVLVVKLYQPKTNRDYFQIILLSFLLVVAASSLTISLNFLVLLTLFLLVSTATLISFEMLRHLGRHLPHAMQERSRSEGGPITALVVVPGEVLQRRVVLHISLVSALCLVFILSFGGILFFAIPRIGVGYFQRSAGQKLVLSGFSDHVRLGAIGAIQLENAVVMRVKIGGNPTAYRKVKWRGVAVDYFDGRVWSKGVHGPILEFTTGKEFRLRTSPVRGPRVYYQVLLEPASSNYLFSMDRVLWVGGNLCPLRHDPFDDSLTGATRLTRRLHYQAMSALPIGSQAQGYADPLPASLRAAYLQLPPLDPRIFSLANRITSGANSIEEKARRIESYLLSNYRYSLDPVLVEQSQPVSTFLFQSRKGHCEYFASAMAMMSRAVGITCRVVNGFRNGEYNDVGGDYIIRGKDAHSWVEAYFPGTGWQTYDPTPAGDPYPAASRLFLAINNYLDAFELFWGEWVLGYDDVIQDALFRDLQDQSSRWLFQFQSKLYRQTLRFQELVSLRNIESRLQIDYSRNRLALYWGGLTVVLLLFLSPRLAEQLRIRRLRKDGQRSSAIAFYSEMMRILERRGKKKPPSWTPIEFLESLPIGRLRTKVEEMTQLYNELRFSPSRLNARQTDQAYRMLSELKLLCRRHAGS